ncbi:MAG: ABC transporter substrate-binding protein [Candidatus Peribacteraceae bacterium]|nr:ABC transporter substrate-binding protein [Candidatus Peribacteraceae bacterium]
MQNRIAAIVGAGTLSLFVLLALAYAFWRTRGPMPTVTLAYPQLLSSALLYVAQENGYFAERGLDVRHAPFPTGRDALEEMLKGGADVAVAYESPMLGQVCRGEDIVALTKIHSSDRDTGLVLRDADVASLRGKRVGVPLGTNAEFVLAQLLHFSGLQPSDVVIADLPPSRVVEAFRSGEVFAAAVWNPLLQEALAAGGRGAHVLFSDVYTEASLLLAKRASLSERGDSFVRLLRALHDAELYVSSHPEESKRIVAAALPQVSLEQVDTLWSDFDFRLGLDHVLVASFQMQAEWLDHADRGCPSLPDVSTLVDPSPLRLVDAAAVTVFQLTVP